GTGRPTAGPRRAGAAAARRAPRLREAGRRRSGPWCRWRPRAGSRSRRSAGTRSASPGPSPAAGPGPARRGPATARRVLEAAGRLFYERGIHAVGVDLIAAEAGVTKKTLYDRFGAKEQIVVECLAGELGPALMLLHEGALVAHGL